MSKIWQPQLQTSYLEQLILRGSTGLLCLSSGGKSSSEVPSPQCTSPYILLARTGSYTHPEARSSSHLLCNPGVSAQNTISSLGRGGFGWMTKNVFPAVFLWVSEALSLVLVSFLSGSGMSNAMNWRPHPQALIWKQGR